MGNAKYIGRVGALAVALGIGTAVATTPWVAVAEPATDSSSASDASSNASNASTAADDSKSATSEDTSVGAHKATDTGLSSDDPRSGIARSSGGAHTSNGSNGSAVRGPDEDDATATPDTAGPTDEEPAESVVDDTSATPKTPEPADEEPVDVDDVSAPDLSAPEESASKTSATEPAAAAAGPSDNDGPASAQQVAVGAPLAAPTPSAAPPHTADPDAGKPAARFSGAADETATMLSVISPPSTSTAPTSAVSSTAVAAQLLPVAPASPVSVLLAWVGLGPLLTDAPVAPVQAPALWGLVEWVRRQGQHTLSNKTPATAYNPAETSQSVDGVISGDLHAFDPLMFTGTQASEHGSVVVNRDGTFVYTPDADFARTGGSDTFSLEVEDGATYKLSGPVGLLQSALHRAAQVLGVSGSDTIDSHPTVKVNPVIATIPVGNGPVGVAVSPDGTTAYVTNTADSTVSMIDTATNTVTTTITVGSAPNSVAVSPDGATAYVTSANDDTVSVIDTATNTVTATIAVGFNPRAVAVSPDGATAYVTNSLDSTVSMIDTATNTVVATVPVGLYPHAVAVSPDGATAYVVTYPNGPDAVSVLDTATNTVIATITVGDQTLGVAVSPDGTRAYVTNADDDTVSVIDTTTNTVVAAITVGDFPIGVAVSPDGTRAYVTNTPDGTVSVIDTTTNTVVATVTVGVIPIGVAVSPDGTRIYVANEFDGTVSVIKVSSALMSLAAVQDDPVLLASPVSLVSDAAPTTAYNPAETSQSVDGVISGDLHAFDPLMFTGTQASEHGSVVVNRDGTFTYTPDADFARIGGSDTFSLEVEDGATYKLSGPVRLLQSALHRAAQVLGVSGSDTIDSHPTVKVIPKVIDTIAVGGCPLGCGGQPRWRPRIRRQRIKWHGVGDRHRHQHRHHHHRRRRHARPALRSAPMAPPPSSPTPTTTPCR